MTPRTAQVNPKALTFEFQPGKGDYMDVRAPAFVAEYGEKAAEVDAIPASELRRIVYDFIRSYRDEKLWAKAERIGKKKDKINQEGVPAMLEAAGEL